LQELQVAVVRCVPATGVRPGLVRQPRDPSRQKPLSPLVDMAAVHPDQTGNLGHRHALREEEDDPAPARMPCRDGPRVLPPQQRLLLRRREGNREGGCPSACHTATFQQGGCGSVAAYRQEEDRGRGALHPAGRARLPERRDAVILRQRSVAQWIPGCHASILPETRALAALCVRALRAHRAASSRRRPLRIDARHPSTHADTWSEA